MLRLTGNDSQFSSRSDVTVTVQTAAGLPYLGAAVPNAAQQGQTGLAVTIRGGNTYFVQGTTQANFGAGITVVSVTVTDAMHATAILNIAADAALGFRDVAVTTGSEVVTLTRWFTVVAGAPVLLSLNPNSGQQGQQNLSVALTGQFTNWVQNTTTVDLGAGITVASLTVNSSTSATAVINIDPSATLGTRTVTLTTTSETVGCAIHPGRGAVHRLLPAANRRHPRRSVRPRFLRTSHG